MLLSGNSVTFLLQVSISSARNKLEQCVSHVPVYKEGTGFPSEMVSWKYSKAVLFFHTRIEKVCFGESTWKCLANLQALLQGEGQNRITPNSF